MSESLGKTETISFDAFKNWLHEHDDRWSFIVLYVGGAILLSVYAGLFWVGMLMLLHFLLELLRHSLAGIDKPFAHALWEVKLDIGLFLFALVIVLYSDSVLAALGLGHAARATQAMRGAQMATRFGIIQRSLRVFFMIVDDLTKFMLAVVKGITRSKNGGALPLSAAVREVVTEDESGPPWRRIGRGDYFSFAFMGGCLAFLLLAPLLTGTAAVDCLAEILAELTP